MGASQSVNKKRTKSVSKPQKKTRASKLNESTPLKLQSINKAKSQKITSLSQSLVAVKNQSNADSLGRSQFYKTTDGTQQLKSPAIKKEAVFERVDGYEKVLLEEINKYRTWLGLSTLTRSDYMNKEVELICTESLKKGKLAEKVHKQYEKAIKTDTFLSQVPFYIDGMNKSLTAENLFATYVMSTWKSRPKVDTDIKVKDAGSCSIVVVRSDKAMCVFMVIYKAGEK